MTRALPLAAILLAAASPAPQVANLKRIELRPGVNILAHLAPDGRDGVVVQAWRESGNAASHHVFLVTLRTPDGEFRLVPLERADGQLADTVADEPHTGEDAIRSVALARGTVDRAPSTLLLIATRHIDPSQGPVGPAPTTIATYRMVHDDTVGSSADLFRRVAEDQTPGPFCTADAALAWRLTLPNAPKPGTPCP